MVLTARKRMSHGFEMLANYTLSKATDDGQGFNSIGGGLFLGSDGVLDPYHRAGERGLSGGDNRHRFTSSVVWQPGFGKDLSNKAAKGFVSGWSLATTVTATTNTRYSGTITSSAVQCLVVVVAPATCPAGSLAQDGGMTGALLSTGGTPMGGRIAWLPRASFKLPSYTDVDLRVAKQFSIHERFNIELRGEMFNLFNSTLVLEVDKNAYNYATPSGSTGACPATGANAHANYCMVPVPTFQQPMTTTGNLIGARQVQFGFRFAF